jgi:hypothetical protein
VTRIRIRNLSSKQDGRLSIKVQASGPPASLPSPAAIDASVVFGAADECASLAWNGPDEAAPHCEGDAARLACR